MTTDNTTPRLVDALTAARNALDRAIPRLPTVIRRLDQEQPGFPTGHTSTGRQDGPDRFQTDDPALKALAALLRAVDAVSRETALLDQLSGNWMRSEPNEKWASKHGVEGQCVSCIRVGHPEIVHRGHLCRRCYERLAAINKRRDELDLAPHLVEVPYACVAHLRKSGKDRYNQMELDEWARNTPDKKSKR